MKVKQKSCDGCGELRHIWKNVTEEGVRKKYCKTCWSCRNSTSTKPKLSSKPIRNRSPKRAKQEGEYSKEAKAFKEEHPFCQACLPGICTGKTHDVHHKAGRVADLLLDQEYWLAVCRQCHEWIETHPIEARDLGYSVSKIQ